MRHLILPLLLASACAPPPPPRLPPPPDLDRLEVRLLWAREAVGRWEAIREHTEEIEAVLAARETTR